MKKTSRKYFGTDGVRGRVGEQQLVGLRQRRLRELVRAQRSLAEEQLAQEQILSLREAMPGGKLEGVAVALEDAHAHQVRGSCRICKPRRRLRSAALGCISPPASQRTCLSFGSVIE